LRIAVRDEPTPSCTPDQERATTGRPQGRRRRGRRAAEHSVRAHTLRMQVGVGDRGEAGPITDRARELDERHRDLRRVCGGTVGSGGLMFVMEESRWRLIGLPVRTTRAGDADDGRVGWHVLDHHGVRPTRYPGAIVTSDDLGPAPHEQVVADDGLCGVGPIVTWCSSLTFEPPGTRSCGTPRWRGSDDPHTPLGHTDDDAVAEERVDSLRAFQGHEPPAAGPLMSRVPKSWRTVPSVSSTWTSDPAERRRSSTRLGPRSARDQSENPAGSGAGRRSFRRSRGPPRPAGRPKWARS